MRKGSGSTAFAMTALMLLVSLVPLSGAHVSPTMEHDHVIITELLVSPSSEEYNGTDWNGDGDIGKYSDQFIELWNPTNATVDIGGWWLDDRPDGGSPPCQIGWNTNLSPDERIVFYRSNTHIEFDYYGGDTVQLQNGWRTVVDEFTYADKDSDYDVSYGRQSDGTWSKVGDPTPGLANDETWPQGSHRQGTCYTQRDDIHEGSYVLKGRVVTMNGEDTVYNQGNILVMDGVIEGVWSDSNKPAGLDQYLTDIDVYETGGTIFPGLVDMHNHYHYNYLPLWDYEVEDTGFYTNRYQWKNNPGYKPEVSWPKVFILQGDRWDLDLEAVKYAEVKAAVGGVTAMQGGPSSSSDAWSKTMVRNIEYYNFGSDNMKTCAVCDAAYDPDYDGSHLIEDREEGDLDAWFVHVAEGVDQSSLNEFQILQDQNLLLPETILIHGVPLGTPEFEKMAEVGSTLVWSPMSNMLLYGDTASVDLAKQAGVRITLAPDWAPSGAKNTLHELKMADWWNREKLNSTFTDYELAQMVTSNAADAMRWGGYIGRIAPGLQADLLVIDNVAEDPYRSLIEAVDPDVRLTIIGGLPVFGDEDIMLKMKGSDFELVSGNGFHKALDVTYSGIPEGTQTFADFEAELKSALEFDRQQMFDDWGNQDYTWTEFNEWLDSSYSSLGAVDLDPIYTYGDDRYFDVLNRSAPFNSQGQIDLYTRYYAVEYDSEGNRTTTFTLPVDEAPDDAGTGDGSDGDTGTVCSDGDTKTADDGCNTCACESGEWVCTERACANDDSKPEESGGFSGLLDPSSAFYWFALAVALVVILGSAFVVFSAFQGAGRSSRTTFGGSDQYFKPEIDLDSDLDLDKPDLAESESDSADPLLDDYVEDADEE